ncbi:dynamin family protein [Aeromonas salmonicida]|uniref:dynamin family protein n=1 Tax=Aeromonas salmonicida TaxID=645 RepID=UPI003D232721
MSREDLLESFRQLEGQFSSSLKQANNLDEEFQYAYQHFQLKMDQHLKNAKLKLQPGNPLSEQIKIFINALKEQDDKWHKELAGRDKGLRFRQGFEDSLLVFVFGKVKSGKSSLGNYIAWGHTDPTEMLKSNSNNQPSYFSHENTHVANGDSSEEAKTRREFRVGAIEATSSIQGFRLPGLTWVDSPGLHSVNKSNGELAKEYVKHADLILYTMSSGAPGRASDLKEIRNLFNIDKKTLLLLTGSDEVDEDEDTETGELVIRGWMMKSETARQTQREYIKGELKKDEITLDDNEIISLSARTAQLDDGDAKMIEESGMASLFTTLRRISQSDGVIIKRSAPLKNFIVFLSACLDDLKPYSEQIEKFNEEFNKLERNLSQSIKLHTRQAQAGMRDVIDEFFDKYSTMRNDEFAINHTIGKVRGEWDKIHQNVAEDAIAAIFSDITREFKSMVRDTWQSCSLTLPNFSVEKVTEQIPDGVTKGNRKRNSGLGSLLGAAAGAFLGPVGAAAGAAIGGAVAGAMSDGAQVRTRTIEMTVGDNLNDIHAEAVEIYSNSVAQVIKSQAEKLTKDLLQDVQKLTVGLNAEVAKMTMAIDKIEQNTKNLLC